MPLRTMVPFFIGNLHTVKTAPDIKKGAALKGVWKFPGTLFSRYGVLPVEPSRYKAIVAPYPTEGKEHEE